MKTFKHISSLIIILLLSNSTFATEYYVNENTGNDQNNGKNESKACKSLFKVSNTKLKPGDVILLAKGVEFKGSIEWTNLTGSKSKPITILSYEYNNSSKKPHINAKGYLNGIKLTDCSHIKIDGISIIVDEGEKS